MNIKQILQWYVKRPYHLQYHINIKTKFFIIKNKPGVYIPCTSNNCGYHESMGVSPYEVGDICPGGKFIWNSCYSFIWISESQIPDRSLEIPNPNPQETLDYYYKILPFK